MSVSGVLCKINHSQFDYSTICGHDQREGGAVAVLEVTGSKGSVQLNGEPVKKGCVRDPHSGDEFMTEVAVKGADIQGNMGKLSSVERRVGDASAVAGASMLASLSMRQDASSRYKSPGQYTSKIHQGTEVPAHSAVHDGADDLDGLEINFTPTIGSDKAAEAGAASKHLPHDCNQDSSIEAGNVKHSGVNDLIRPLYRMFARSSNSKQKLSKSMSKQVLEERTEWIRDSQLASTSGMSLRCAMFKEDIRAGILDGKSIDVSFDNFPYYLS